MIAKLLKQMTWEDIREIVQTADSFLTEERFDYTSEESYYMDVMRRLRKKESLPPPLDERYPEVLKAAESAAGWRLSGTRDAWNSLLRAFIAYQLRHEGYTYSEIGRALGRDHSSVMHMEQRIDDMISLPNAYYSEVNLFRKFEESLSK